MISVFYMKCLSPTFSITVNEGTYLYEGLKNMHGVRENASIWIVPGTLTADDYDEEYTYK